MDYAAYLIKTAMSKMRQLMRMKFTPAQTARFQRQGYLPSPERLTAGLERGNVNLAKRLGVRYENRPAHLLNVHASPMGSKLEPPSESDMWKGLMKTPGRQNQIIKEWAARRPNITLTGWSAINPLMRKTLPKYQRSRITPLSERATAAAVHRHELTEAKLQPGLWRRQVDPTLVNKQTKPSEQTFYSHVSPNIVSQEAGYIAGLPQATQRTFLGMRTIPGSGEIGVEALMPGGSRTRHQFQHDLRREFPHMSESDRIDQAFARIGKYHQAGLIPRKASWRVPGSRFEPDHAKEWQKLLRAARASGNVRLYEYVKRLGPNIHGLDMVFPKDIHQTAYWKNFPKNLPRLTQKDITPLTGGRRRGPTTTELVSLQKASPELVRGIYQQSRAGPVAF